MVPAMNATTSAANTMRLARSGLTEPQADHEIEEERRQQQAPANQRHFVGRRKRGHDDGADAEHRRHERDARVVPAIVEPLRGEDEHEDHRRHVHAEANHVRDARMLGGENEVIEDREAEHRAGRHHDRDAIPDAQARTVLAAEFALERFVETQETESLRRAGVAASEVLGDEFFASAILPSLLGRP